MKNNRDFKQPLFISSFVAGMMSLCFILSVSFIPMIGIITMLAILFVFIFIMNRYSIYSYLEGLRGDSTIIKSSFGLILYGAILLIVCPVITYELTGLQFYFIIPLVAYALFGIMTSTLKIIGLLDSKKGE